MDTNTQIDLNPSFKQALAMMKEGKQNLFITGRAGTGKSTLLQYFCDQQKTRPVVLAPTGVAALNVRGQTIHRFFGFQPDVTVEKIQSKKIKPKQVLVYKKLVSLIIDEVSMLRADLLDCVDVFLKMYGPHKGKIFGGVQMIFIGDLYQLPPVVSFLEKEAFFSHYKTPFFFSARAFENFKIKIIELRKVYRQKDEKFVSILNRIRNNSVQSGDLEILNQRHQPGFKPPLRDFYVYLSSTNKTANDINHHRLNQLNNRLHVSQARIDGDFGKEYFPTLIHLKFKVGAQVMLLNNDSKNRWVNGSMGRIVSFRGDGRSVCIDLFSTREQVDVSLYTWEIYQFSLSGNKKNIVTQVAGTFTQFPFRLAWALTIHKSQGKTFEKVIFDTRGGMFASGQAYVALSRCVSLEGLILKSPFQNKHILVDERIFPFLKSQGF